MMRLNTGLLDEPDLDPSTNFSRKSQPSITTDLSLNVVGVLGKEVRLACHVTNLGNKTVIFALIQIAEIKIIEIGNIYRPNEITIFSKS